ncbi:hypothetical protein K458DRAFT_424366 [Lentithecium fluviatile CBS 122367]|uniref:Uncharacterized protein n=1 Tax=Lentithecium fluviatile CBS 122367 TaxID=1168545 RepID=A0A6G1IF57_9PLEO|nr:hypothetical protein K458DRAFT_424366 [Lentithecium fluviatile CBS 122367]
MIIPQKQPSEDSRRLTAFVERYDLETCNQRFNLALDIKQRACAIESEDEQRWSEILEQLVFGRYIQQARRQEWVLTKQTAAGVLQRFRAERDHVWHFGRGVLQEYGQESQRELTAPKPDLCFSFHAIGWGANELGPMGKDDYVQNFTQTKLVRLYEEYRKISKEKEMQAWQFGFMPSPVTAFYKSQGVKNQQCFPWLICEWKHQGKRGTLDEKRTYFQAANAAAVCLTLLANAAATERWSLEKGDLRPVICMTFVGESIRVWIAYVASIDEQTARYKYKMQCIWRGSLRSVIDNVMLSVIIDRVHFWAMNHLKPWLSSCVDRWARFIEERQEEIDSRIEAEGGHKAAGSGDESPNFSFKRAATLDDFIDNDEQESDDEASYKAGTEDDSDDSNAGDSVEEDSEQERVEDPRDAVRRTRSASNTPKKSKYQIPFRPKKS